MRAQLHLVKELVDGVNMLVLKSYGNEDRIVGGLRIWFYKLDFTM